MCIPGAFAALAGTGGAAAGATAAGATAAAGATFGGALQTLGTIVGIGGSLIQGIQSANAARAQAAAIDQQRQTEQRLNAVQDQRTRQRFNTAIAQQRAELAARGVSLDSPAAMLLGQIAAQELSFESQAVRSTGFARDAELSAEARMVRARGAEAMLKGTFSAAGTLLKSAPTLWPGLADRRIGSGRVLA